jgi:hypothetical protein
MLPGNKRNEVEVCNANECFVVSRLIRDFIDRDAQFLVDEG